MKKGINSNALLKQCGNDEFAMVDCVRKYNFDCLDLTVDGRYYPFDKEPWKIVKKHYKTLYKYALKNGISFFQMHAKYVRFPEYLFDNYFNVLKRTVQIAGCLHCNILVVHPLVFPVDRQKNNDEEEKCYNVSFFKKLVPFLRRYNVKIALENIYDWDENKIRLIYASNPKNLSEYVDEIHSPYVGVCLDTGHLNIQDGNAADAVTLYGKKLFAVHLHDNHGTLDEHLVPGRGTVDFNALKKALKAVNFQGIYNFELKDFSLETDLLELQNF